MSNWMPNISPEVLKAAMARQPMPPALGQQPLARPGAPAPLQPLPPASSAPAATPSAAPAPSATPVLPVQNQQAQVPPPKPSDDPAISPEMRRALQPTQDATAALDAEQKKVSDLQTSMSSLHAPTHDEYKPALWKRIAAPFVGALAGKNAYPAVSAMLNGPYEQAMQDYQTKRGGLQEQLDAERGINVPLANDRARIAQEGFSNWLNTKKETREQTAFDNEPTGRMPEVRNGPDGQPHYFQKTKGGGEIEVPEPANITAAHERENADSNTPAPGARPEKAPATLAGNPPAPSKVGQQLRDSTSGKVVATSKDGKTWTPNDTGEFRIKTKGGGYMPWSPKTPEEGAMVGDPRATSLFNREHPGREGRDEEDWSPADKRAFDSRTRALQTIVNARQHVIGLLNPADPLDAPQRKIAQSEADEANAKIDAIYQEIEARHRRSTKSPSDQP
jgi:hypothetical protein